MRHRRLIVPALALALAGCSGSSSPSFNCPGPVGTSYDSDGDLLTDAQEALLGTDPKKADTDGDGWTDYEEVMAGTNPLDPNSHPGSGQVATIKQAASVNDLIGGFRAKGQVGDWVLTNDKIHAIVQDLADSQMQVGTYGGNLIDADVIRPPNVPGNSRVGNIIPLVNLGVTTLPNKVVVVNDGSNGHAAILRTCGVDQTFQYLDLTATFKILGFALGYDTNKTLPIKMSNDYILAPGSNTVEVVTTFGNEGSAFNFIVGDVIEKGATEEIYNTNYMGFGMMGFQDLESFQPPTQYMGFVAPGATWGYVTDGDPNTAITIAGVSVWVQGFPSAFAVIGSSPNSPSPPSVLPLPSGSLFSYHRGIVVTDGSRLVDEVAQVYFARHGGKATAHSGTVADSSGNKMAGVRVAALENNPADTTGNLHAVDATVTDSSGNYTLTLPDGPYWILADFPGRASPSYTGQSVTGTSPITTLTSKTTRKAAAVSFTQGSAAPDITFAPVSTLVVNVTDAFSNPASGIPARLEVVGAVTNPGDSIFRDQRESVSGSSVVANQLSGNGQFIVPLEPGSYDVYVNHGLEYSQAIAKGVVVSTAGLPTTVNLSIGRVVQTPGWISADFHVHMADSPDSVIPLDQRTLNAATDGLDVLVTTDHDYVTDLSSYIAALGLSTALSPTTVPGEEITTWDEGHFNTWPLTHNPAVADGGAVKWAGPAGTVTHPTVDQIFQLVDQNDPTHTHVFEVNHPRGFRLQSYYSAIHLDTATLQSKEDPLFLRTPRPANYTTTDTGLFTKKFHAQEVMNGADAITAGPTGLPSSVMTSDMNDYFTMLSQGLRIAAIGNSDTHKVFSNQLGYPRNYVKLSDDNPAHLKANLTEFANTIIQGPHTFFTTGPFLQVLVTGTSQGAAAGAVASGGPGDLVNPRASNTVDVTVTLDMPQWVTVDTVKLYVNTPNTTTPPDTDGNTAAPVAQHVLPLVLTSSQVGVSVPPIFHKTGTVTFTGVSLPAGKDSWIVATASAENTTASLFPVIPAQDSNGHGVHPFAMTSAILVDGNHDGAYAGPGITLTPGFAPPSDPPVRIWDANKGEIPNQPTEEIREQYERLIHGSCDVHHDASRRK